MPAPPEPGRSLGEDREVVVTMDRRLLAGLAVAALAAVLLAGVWTARERSTAQSVAAPAGGSAPVQPAGGLSEANVQATAEALLGPNVEVVPGMTRTVATVEPEVAGPTPTGELDDWVRRSQGLGEAWNEPDIEAVGLPMLGVADSLNVAAASAVLLYESRRQRGLPPKAGAGPR